MATPNYSYEKRQRELAKKRKAEEKRQKKLTRTDGGPSDEPSGNPVPGSAEHGAAASSDTPDPSP